MKGKTLYTVQRARKDDTLYGPSHASIDAEITVCGQHIDHHWFITNATFDGECSCRKCQKFFTVNTPMDAILNHAKTGGNQ